MSDETLAIEVSREAADWLAESDHVQAIQGSPILRRARWWHRWWPLHDIYSVILLRVSPR